MTDCYVNKGYRGHTDKGDAAVHLSDSSTRKLTRTLKSRRKHHAAVQPKIGHLRTDNRMGRSFLKGLSGNAINAVLAAAGANLQKLLCATAETLFFWPLFPLKPAISAPENRRTLIITAA